MTHQLPLTDAAITDCRDHLNQHPDTDSAIIAYLTRHVNGLMCAEIEWVVTRLIRERLETGTSDEATANFLKTMPRSTVRNATFREIRDTLTRLGSAYSSKFSELVDQNVKEDGIEKLGMAVGKRNQNAHEVPPDITFRELNQSQGGMCIYDTSGIGLGFSPENPSSLDCRMVLQRRLTSSFPTG